MRRTRTTFKLVCPVCKNDRHWQSAREAFYLWRICRCCDAWVLASSDQTKAYPKEYYGGSAAKFTGLAYTFRRHFHRARARSVLHWVQGHAGIIYDLGCGDGLFLEAILKSGFPAYGYEPEAVPREQAEQRLKKRLDSKLRTALTRPRFSAITCWQVIEHIRDPQKLLQWVRRNLVDGGLLAISTVNLDSVQAKMFGTHWLHLDPPRHFWVGSKSSVVAMLTGAGFKILGIRHRPLEFGPVGWVDSLMNLFDPERDRLLRCLKRGCHGPKDRVVWLLSAILSPLAVVLSLAESLAGRPATFEIYARVENKGARRQGG